MSVNRTSTNLVRFFGAQLSAEFSRGSFTNVFSSGTGQERSVDPGVVRLVQTDLVPASINTNEFDAVSAFLQTRGSSKQAANAMAVVFIDVANKERIPAMQLLDALDTDSVKLSKNTVYRIINQLRDITNQLSNASSTDNKQSLISRNLKPYA